MDYSVTRFIKEDLDMSVNAFAKKVALPQSRFSMYQKRETSVGSLPLEVIADLSAESGLSYEKVAEKLFQYEIDFESNKLKGDA